MRMPGDERIRSGAGALAAVGVAVALLVSAVTVGRVSARSKTVAAVRPAAARLEAHDVLNAEGIVGIGFGASPAAVRQAIDALVGQRGGPYARGGSCEVDHEITWRDGRTAPGEPTLIIYFRRAAFAGYQFGNPDGVGPPRRPPRGWTLATTRGLRVGDTMGRGRHLYGRSFAISTAQGGRTSRGLRLGQAQARRRQLAERRLDDRRRRRRLRGADAVTVVDEGRREMTRERDGFGSMVEPFRSR
jgi:hypothetical protein